VGPKVPILHAGVPRPPGLGRDPCMGGPDRRRAGDL